MDKPLSEWTLKEVKKYCEGRGRTGCCVGCRFADDSEECVIADVPENWEITEENYATAAADTNVGHKPAKPRLAEVLGVEVGERFRIKGVDQEIIVDKNGKICTYEYEEPIDPIDPYEIFDAINHPESIIRAPRMTEAELAICKAVGAKLVSRDSDENRVCLWNCEPVNSKPFGGFYSPELGGLGWLVGRLFPSVKPGDCICVEDAQHDD